MKEAVIKIKDRWHGFSKREKQVVSVGGFFVLLFMLYQCLWSPLLDHVAHLREKLSSSQKLLVWMQNADKKMPAKTRAHHSAVSPMMLLSQIKKQIQAAGLAPCMKELKQTGNDTIELHFQKIQFNALIKLLDALMKEQGTSLEKISVIALARPGYVNADVYLKG